MIATTCANGVVLWWDDTLVPGDLVTTYESGYFTLLRVEPRKGSTPLMYFRLVAKADGTLVKGKAERCCDASYVRRVSRVRIEEQWSDELEAAHRKRDNLLGLLPG
jgi:hypothetical protein